jgi:phosphate-selective porin OprO and OprP
MKTNRTSIQALILAAAVLGPQIAGPSLWAADPNADQIEALKKQIEALTEKVQTLEQRYEQDKKAAGTKGQQLPAISIDTNGVPLAPPDPRVEQLDQQVRILQRKQELEQEAAVEKAKTAPVVTVGYSGLQVRSGDSNFVFGLRGYFQADGRFGVGESSDVYNDTFLMRRIRPIFEGTLYKKFDYRVMLDFGSGQSSSTSNDGFVQDAYVNARFLPEVQLQIGKMKEPVGLERLQSGANLLFIERGYPTALVPNRDVGAMVQGDVAKQRLNYQVGVFNGVPDGGSSDFQNLDDGMNFAGRLFARPFLGSDVSALEGFGVGVAGTYGSLNGPLRSYVSPAQQTIFTYGGTGVNTNVVADGQQWRVTPQGYYYYGPFGLFGEYVISSQEVARSGSTPVVNPTGTLVNKAWQVAGSWFLTGEKNSWKPVNPAHPLFSGGWGAWELAARIQGIDFDDDAFPVFANPDRSPTSALSWGVGVNWYMNRNLKLSVNYEQTHFDGGDQNPVTANDEQVILGQVQVSF